MRAPFSRLALLAAAFLSVPFLITQDAGAFCGFYVAGGDAKLFNDATQVVLMRDGNRTVLSMQNTYKGPPENFAMVIPVPIVLQKANVKTLKKELFEKVDRLSAPRLVEYWEQDPCTPKYAEDEGAAKSARGGGPPGAAMEKKKDLGVKIEAQFTVGEYEVVVLSAQDAAGLETWLKREKYKIPEGSEPYLKPYVQNGSKFFVARVDVKKVKFDSEGRVDLSPLRFHYDTNELSLPVRLGLINSAGTQDLIINVLAKGQRYEPANYPSVTIPTNLDVIGGTKERFGSFYASLFDRTLEKHPKAIVTEYSWDASTCDPCPGPTLDDNDFQALGADALTPPGGGGPSAQPMGKGRGRGLGGSGDWVITRLHARYSRDALGADIIFKAAPPIAGGREMMGASGQLENGPQSSPFNNFQGRYAIRHAWKGAIACPNPVRNQWGGPPGGGEPAAAPATRLAFVARGAPLAQMVTRDVPELDVKALGSTDSTPPPIPTTAPTVTSSGGPPPPTMNPNAPKSGGCGSCTATSAMGAGDVMGVLAVTGALAAWLRRKRKR